MTVTINGTSGVSLCDTNSVPTAALQASAVTQPKVGAGVAGNGPAFSAWQSSLQSLSNNVVTKVQFQTKEYDTASCFDNVTNYRFTPNVAGYYHFTASAAFQSGASSRVLFYVYKNGSVQKRVYDSTPTTNYVVAGGCDIYMNGTTDYAEVYILQTSGSAQNTDNTQPLTYFQGFLARSA